MLYVINLPQPEYSMAFFSLVQTATARDWLISSYCVGVKENKRQIKIIKKGHVGLSRRDKAKKSHFWI